MVDFKYIDPPEVEDETIDRVSEEIERIKQMIILGS